MNRKQSVWILVVMVIVMIAMANANAEAVTPLTKQWIPSAGKGDGIGGAKWMTTVWVHNPSQTSIATVSVFFSERVANPTIAPPAAPEFQVRPGETRVFADALEELFHVSKYGALYFESDYPVSVRSRIFNANSPTPTGPGSAGQAFDGIDSNLAVGIGESTVLQGVPIGSAFRFNFNFAEVEGKPVKVRVERLDSLGSIFPGLGQEYSIGGYGAQQFPVAVLGVPQSRNAAIGGDDQIRLTVTSGEGRILASGSLVDNVTGDPTTVTQEGPLVRSGIYTLVAYHPSGFSAGSMALWVDSSSGTPTLIRYTANMAFICGDRYASTEWGGNLSISYSIPDGHWKEGMNPAGLLFDGTLISWRDVVEIQLRPDGTVIGTVIRKLGASLGGIWAPCAGESTVYYLVGGWAMPLPE